MSDYQNQGAVSRIDDSLTILMNEEILGVWDVVQVVW